VAFSLCRLQLKPVHSGNTCSHVPVIGFIPTHSGPNIADSMSKRASAANVDEPLTDRIDKYLRMTIFEKRQFHAIRLSETVVTLTVAKSDLPPDGLITRK
jgi:hypothetical protein